MIFNNQTIILLVLLLGIIAQATGIDLANNTNILLLLLLALGAYSQTTNQGGCCSQRTYL